MTRTIIQYTTGRCRLPLHDCNWARCPDLAPVALYFQYEARNGKAKWARKHFCEGHAQAWLDRNMRQLFLFD